MATQNDWKGDQPEELDTKRIIHQIQFNLTTGNIINVSESCGSSFGLKASLFKKDYTKDISIDLIAPQISNSKNFTALRSPRGLECTLDTTELEKDHIHHMNNQGEEYCKGEGVDLKKDYNSSGSSKSSSEAAVGEFSRSYDQVDNTLKQDGFGMDESASSKYEIFEDFSVKHNLRRAQILAWFDCERSYGDDRIVCLRFVEKRLKHDLNGSDTFDDGVETDEELVSLNEDYEARLVRRRF